MLAAQITDVATALLSGMPDTFLAEPAPPDGGGLPELPGAEAPPGSELITQVIGYVRWIAGAAIILGFLAGLALFAGGRIADHQRFGRMGTITMMASMGSAFLYAIGYSLLTTFASGGG